MTAEEILATLHEVMGMGLSSEEELIAEELAAQGLCRHHITADGTRAWWRTAAGTIAAREGRQQGGGDR